MLPTYTDDSNWAAESAGIFPLFLFANVLSRVQGAGSIMTGLYYSPTFTFNATSALTRVLYVSGIWSGGTAGPGSTGIFYADNQIKLDAGQSVGSPGVEYSGNHMVLTTTGAVAAGTTGAFTGYSNLYQLNVVAGGSQTITNVWGVRNGETIGAGAGGTLTITNLFGYLDAPISGATTGTRNITNRYGIRISDISVSGGTVNVLAEHIGVDVLALSSLTSPLVAGVRSAVASGTGKWSFYSTGSANNAFTGNVRIGDTTAPTFALEVNGAFAMDTGGTGTIYGSKTTAFGLTLRANSVDITTGTITLSDTTSVWPGLTALATLTTYNLITEVPALTAAGGVIPTVNGLNFAPTIADASGIVIATAVNGAPVYTQTASASTIFKLFSSSPSFSSSNGSTLYAVRTLSDAPTLLATGASGTTSLVETIFNGPSIQATGNSATVTVTDVSGIKSLPIFKSNTGGGTPSVVTITNRRVVWMQNPTYTQTGTLVVSNNIGLDCDSQTFSTGNRTVSNVFAVRSAINTGTGGSVAWFLYSSGTADSSIAGNLRLGDNTAPTALLDIAGKTTFTSAGLMTKYNGVATTGWGLPAVYGYARAATGRTAAVASVATYTVGAADGSFLVSANVLITTGTTHNFTVTVAYTDEGNTTRTVTMNFSSLAGVLATAITSVAGVPGAVPYEGVPLHIRAKASTAITIATTGTFTAVTYNVEGMITQIA